MSKRLNILVVDDDKDNAHTMAEMFELDGHVTETVYSGDSAIEAYMHRDFDIAFIDVVMPGKNGVESFLEIRRLKPKAKVFMMSGYSVEQLVQQALSHVAFEVFSKSQPATEILAALTSVGNDGVVLSETVDANSGEYFHRLLREAGIKARVLREPRTTMLQPPSEDDGVLIYDFRGTIIEGIGVCKRVRSAGTHSPAIVVAGRRSPNMISEPLLRDFSATGVVNKPIDPAQILSFLQEDRF